MESPAPLVFAWVHAHGAHAREPAPLALLALWLAHYGHRAFVYPLRLRGGRPMPAAIALLGACFNAFNAWLNAAWTASLGAYPTAWLWDPRFVCGAALFALGLAVNLRADATLRSLRGPGEAGYKIPRGGLYERVSCPNYLGEITLWWAWALATWSLSGVAFALFTCANLAPRAAANHAWYRATFADYPPTRRALIPWVW
jgi:protein-S-isoprenylcysteine O-methyltransferase Ste14